MTKAHKTVCCHSNILPSRSSFQLHSRAAKMEADERLRWLEARIASSLRPRGDELRALLADEENRSGWAGLKGGRGW